MNPPTITNLAPLYEAFHLAQSYAATVDVPKDGHNAHFGYDYTTAKTMFQTGRDVLNRFGLALIPLGLETVQHDHQEVKTDKHGRASVNASAYDVRRSFALTHSVSGGALVFAMDWPVDLADGKKSRDKATAASSTTLLGYAYRDLLALGGLREGDVDAAPVDLERKAIQEAAAQELAEANRKAEARRAMRAAAKKLDEQKEATRLAESTAAKKAVEAEPVVEAAEEVLAPGADDLEARGWDRAYAEEIAALTNATRVDRAALNVLCKAASKVLGLKGAAAKKALGAKFLEVGVDIARKEVPTGLQLKQWALNAFLPF